MSTPWIDLECPSCREQWEDDPADLPAPGNEFTCEHCDDERPVSEFVKTPEGLEIHENFHA
ncbi:hypothetical protein CHINAEXTREME_11145 [Halobiforma lacisalsi AJ5]|uniref:DUF7836 domain-containing protein n=2 Tax=Natronobacterium TaxID=2256 RepID=M0L7H8_NATLA|nr:MULTISPECIES: hypothetical protein [Halobiforma]APW98314.1 hypothetical protein CHINAEXTREME_11145 [Halobiforma lacisalsi AJ5]EMA27915.1 hypothetical protein C445_19722 [Halobiforma lacisalsi AJ5]SFC49917.1 hypothetical protein SAMN05444422_10998 [Halobiforma haloterrestris]